MYLNTFDKSQCCACTACKHICPKDAITFIKDNEGFQYPEINNSLCIGCGLCEKVCPIETPSSANLQEPLIFGAKLKDIDQVKKSTSGGIFYLLAKYVIGKGGIVYGAAFDDNLRLRHIGVETLEDLELLRGSKYLQSDLENVFKTIKSFLIRGRWVYFVGTGCQVAGLKSYLRKEYETLLTTDLVCHGVPSQKLFDTHLQYLREKYKASKVVKYQFRDNSKGIGCEIVDLENDKGKRYHIYNPTYEISPYLYSFMYAYTLRYSCYDCKFARIPRQGDFTLADYWGAKQYFPHINIDNGFSLVLTNNKRSLQIWNEIKDSTINVAGNIKQAVVYNNNILQSTVKPTIRDGIYERIEREGYSSIAKKEFRSPNYFKIRLKYFFKSFQIFNSILAVVRHILVFFRY